MYRTKAKEQYQTAVDSMLDKYRHVRVITPNKATMACNSMTSARSKRTKEKIVEISRAGPGETTGKNTGDHAGDYTEACEN